MTGEPITAQQLTALLALHPDDDVRMEIHNYLVPVGEFFYDGIAQAIVLAPMPGNELRIATYCCTGKDMSTAAQIAAKIEGLTKLWQSENPIGRANKMPPMDVVLGWIAQ